MEETKDRIIYMDMIKGFAMLCIIIGHIFGENYTLQSIICSFHVPIYFIVSGLLIKYNEEQRGKEKVFITFQKVIEKLIIPYVFFSLLNLAIYIIQKADALYIRDFFVHTFVLAGIGALWFMPALAISKLLFAIVLKQKSKLIQISIIVCLTVLTLFSIESTGNIVKLTLQRSILGTMFISIGYFCYDLFNKTEIPLMAIIVILMLSFFISYVNGPLSFFTLNNNRIVITLLVAMIASFTIILIFKNKLHESKILSFIGENSLILMATHQIVYLNLLYLLRDFQIIPKVLIFTFSLITIELIIIFICNKYLPFLVREEKK